MRIFRVENKTYAIGPFHDVKVLRKMQQILGFQYHGCMPTARSDGLRRTAAHFCGCETLQQIQKWFPPKIHELLRESQFEIVEYEVPEEDVQVGKTQVIFLRERATVVGVSQF